jgi:hypothetical protein
MHAHRHVGEEEAAGIGLVYTAGVSWLWITLFDINTIGGIVIIVAGTAGLFIYGICAGTSGSVKEFFFYAIGLALHAASIYLTSQAPLIMPYQKIAVALAIVYVIAGLPLANRRFLIRETQQKSSLSIVPHTVLRGNKIILFFLLVGMILLSFWRTLLDGIMYIAGVIADFIGKIIEWLGSFMQPPGEQQGPAGEQMQLPPAESNPVVSLILDILTYIFVLAIVFFIIRYLVKNYKRIYAALYSWFSSFFNRFQKWSTTEQGYVDKQESLLKTEAPKRMSFLRRLFQREPRWRDMKDNASRVRFLYTKFVLDNIRKGFHFIPSETSDETIKRIQDSEKDEARDHNTLRSAYRQARYGEKPVEDDTVKSLKDIYHR